MHYFSNKSSKIAKSGAFRPQLRLTFDVDDVKLRDLAKLWFFRLIMTKSNFEKSVMTLFQCLSDVIIITTLKNVNKITHNIFLF